MIIYDVLQHYYDNRRSPERWSLLLMSPLAENKEEEHVHSDSLSEKKTINAHFNRHET